jgi:hypothetical protein
MTKIITIIGALMLGMTSMAQVPAFPGAEGFGRYVTGGRGGKVIHVTTLNDSGKGSLREALSTSGKRTIVFDVAGNIVLKSALSISKGDVTIAGQTAPGDGICITNFSTQCKASNVIVRFIRFRLGDQGTASDGTNDQDTFWGRNLSNIMIDHCSMSWSTDECSSWYDNANFTMQWCILSESLANAGHEKGSHGYGGIWGGHSATFHHTLLADHNSRNPRFCGSRFCNREDIELVDYRNCVVYNWGQTNSGYAAEGGRYNFVNNYYKSGPGTANGLKYRIFQASADDGTNSQAKGVYGHFYVNGNYMEDKGENWDWNGFIVDNRNNASMTKTKIKPDTIYPYGTVTTHTAAKAYEKVLAYAGVSHKRDVVDLRVTMEAQERISLYTGSVSGIEGIIDSQQDVGGWPVLKGGTKATDTDNDGIPDAWETANGLNPNDASDATAYSIDPKGYYTNIEVYCNSLVQDIMLAGNEDAESAVNDYYPRYVKEDGTVVEAVNAAGIPDTNPGTTPETPSDLTYEIAQTTHGTDWNFTNGISISNTNGKTYAAGKENGIKYSAGTQYTIQLPADVHITAIDFAGYNNYGETDAYLGEVNGTSYGTSDYVFPQKDAEGNYTLKTHTVKLSDPATSSLTFTPQGKQVVLVITLKGYSTSTGIAMPDMPTESSSKYYNLQGMEIGQPQKGIYIRIDRTADGRKTVRKILNK